MYICCYLDATVREMEQIPVPLNCLNLRFLTLYSLYGTEENLRLEKFSETDTTSQIF